MKLTKEDVLEKMLSDTRIASWVRTEYRNLLRAEPEPADPKARAEGPVPDKKG